MKRLGLLAIIVLAAVAGYVFWPTSAVEIPFAATSAPSMDFARLEAEMPLTAEHRRRLMPADLKAMTQEQVDQIYGRLTAGPIPDGPFDGDLFFARGVDGETRVAEIVGGHLKGRLANLKIRNVEFLGRTLWKGKVFFREERVLRNRIEDLAILRPILGDNIGDIQKLSVDGRDAYLLFPARLYCGQSLLDGRRESVIIDYAFTDEIPGYREMPDQLAGRTGLRIRDEIRMVRPGFYLGRAYLNRIFGLNFTLYRKADAEAAPPATIAEDCWTGTQSGTSAATN